jgi:hypothetical protein
MSDRKRAQRYLELASKATEGPWYAVGGEVNTKGDGTYVGYPSSPEAIASLNDMEYIENPNAEQDAQFIAVSRTEGPWLAKRLLEALDVLEHVAEEQIYKFIDGGWKYVPTQNAEMARQFLEGGGE